MQPVTSLDCLILGNQDVIVPEKPASQGREVYHNRQQHNERAGQPQRETGWAGSP